MLLLCFALENKDEIAQLGLTDYIEQQGQLCCSAEELTHADAIKKCNELGIYKNLETKEPFGERDDIPEAQERQLIDQMGKVVLLTKFPREFKSFYMALDPEDPSRVLGCDVEVPGVGEIIGSGVREPDPNRLQQRLIEAGLIPDDYREYIDLRKYGFGMTSGMGLGVDRMLTWLLKLPNIRDVVTFPRYPGYARP
jgi:asparaginyl-tRNA synthetase